MFYLDFDFSIRFDLFIFLAFFIGFFCGLIFIVLIYLLICLKSLKSSKKVIGKHYENAVDEEIINEIIKKEQSQFLLLRKNNKVSFALRTVILELINEIAQQYYPNSKHPIAELTLDELIKLDYYITDMIEMLLNKKGLRILKNVRVSTILNIVDAKNNIENSKPVKVGKKFYVDKIIKGVHMALNIVNPFYWFKKLVVSPSFNFIIKKLFLSIIGIVGEQTNRVYSKKIFIEEEEELQNIIDALNDEELGDTEELMEIK